MSIVPGPSGDFNIDDFIENQLLRKEFSPGHGEGDVNEEVKNRLAALVTRAAVWEMSNASSGLVEELKTRGVKALCDAFPGQRDLIKKEIYRLNSFQGQRSIFEEPDES